MRIHNVIPNCVCMLYMYMVYVQYVWYVYYYIHLSICLPVCPCMCTFCIYSICHIEYTQEVYMHGRRASRWTNGYNSIHTIYSVHKPYTYTTQINSIIPRYIHSMHTKYTHKTHMHRWTDGSDRWMYI